MHFSDISICSSEPVDLLPQLRTTLRDYGIKFTYFSEYDKNGAIYWLGTEFGTNEKYENPTRYVCVHANTNGGKQYIENFFRQYKVGDLQYASTPHNITITMDFSAAKIRIKPNYYTIGYITHGNGHCILRNWQLIGSVDGKHWETIKEHIEDGSITKEKDSASWPVVSNTAYQYLAIRRTGPVSGNPEPHSQCYTATSGFEVYGTVYKQ